VDQIAVRIEGAEHAGFIKSHVGLDLFQGVFRDEERSLHGGVVSPKPHGAAGRIKETASIWKIQCHDLSGPRFRRSLCMRIPCWLIESRAGAPRSFEWCVPALLSERDATLSERVYLAEGPLWA
jgi:hypothetical protein